MKSNFRLIVITAFFLVAGIFLWLIVSRDSGPSPDAELRANSTPMAPKQSESISDSADGWAPIELEASRRPARRRPSRERGSIHGHVVDQDDLPLADIEVLLSGTAAAESSAFSDSDGAFSFNGLPEAIYTISASVPSSSGEGQLAGSTQAKLDAGQRLKGIRLRLTGDAGNEGEARADASMNDQSEPAIRGRVVDKEDNPIPDILVQAVGRDHVRVGHTNGQGDFILGGLEEELYSLLTSTDRYTNAKLEGIPARSAGNVLRLEDTSTIVGRVIRSDTGVPLTDYEFAVLTQPPRTPRQLQSAAWETVHHDEGALEATGVQARVPLVVATRAEGFVATITNVEPLRPGESSYPITIALNRGAQIEGLVTDARGTPLPKALIYEQDLVGRRFILAETSQAGTFFIDGLGRKEIVLEARHEEYMPGTTAVALNPTAVAHAEIVLRDGGSIEGTLQRGDIPIEGVVLTVASTTQQNLTFRTVSDTEGQYVIKALPSGEFTVMVHANAQRRREFGTYRTKAYVEEGQVTVVDIVFPAVYGVLEGTVYLDGQAAGNGRVIAEITTDGGLQRFSGHVRDGLYRVESLPPGPAKVSYFVRFASNEPLQRKTIHFQLAEGENLHQSIQFSSRR